MTRVTILAHASQPHFRRADQRHDGTEVTPLSSAAVAMTWR
jgi:hypothetical protein